MFTFIAADGTTGTFADLPAFFASLPAESHVHGTAVVNYSTRGGQLIGRVVDMSHEYTRNRYGI